MARLKKTDISMDDFFVWFRKRVRDPLLDQIGKQAKLEMALDHVVPQVLYDEIIRLETNPQISGTRKWYGVLGRLMQTLEGYGAGEYAVILVPAIEGSVRFLYRKHFEPTADAFGIEEKLEQWFGAPLDSGKKAAPEPKEPEPKEPEPEEPKPTKTTKAVK